MSYICKRTQVFMGNLGHFTGIFQHRFLDLISNFMALFWIENYLVGISMRSDLSFEKRHVNANEMYFSEKNLSAHSSGQPSIRSYL